MEFKNPPKKSYTYSAVSEVYYGWKYVGYYEGAWEVLLSNYISLSLFSISAFNLFSSLNMLDIVLFFSYTAFLASSSSLLENWAILAMSLSYRAFLRS